MLIPELVRIARHTMKIVRLNIAFTAVYNLAGLLLATTGLLPLILLPPRSLFPIWEYWRTLLAFCAKREGTQTKNRRKTKGIEENHLTLDLAQGFIFDESTVRRAYEFLLQRQ